MRESFERILTAWLNNARANNEPHLVVISEFLHIAAGGYPGRDHRMPVCCNVMREYMQNGDLVLEEPASGQGASLKIQYFLH